MMQNIFFGETASNLLHGLVAAMFGFVTLAAAMHVVIGLA
jgi:hypothetical protein